MKGKTMKKLRHLALMSITAGLFVATAHNAAAQVAVSIGAPPVCPYGYYEVPPYNCAPDGYYGPEWFSGGVFIGAGPWFHGPDKFYGHVDNHFHPDHGYKGGYPVRGEAASRPVDKIEHFKGNEMRD